MKAAVIRAFGGPDVVHIEDVEKPVPGTGEVLLRVRTTTVSAADQRVRSRILPKGTSLLASSTIGSKVPKIPVLGMDVAGIVEAVGPGVPHLQVGDEVVALLGDAFGGHAEYALVRGKHSSVVAKPAAMNWEEAAALIFGGWTAETYLSLVTLGPGVSVLVNGASGAVGSAAVQLAARTGAEVTGVCSGGNAELVRSLGAGRVIDYTQTDVLAEGRSYDVVVDCVGNFSFRQIASLVAPGGALLSVISDLPGILLAGVRGLTTRKRIVPATAKFDRDALRRVVELAAAGEFTPVIDRVHELADIAEAHRYVNTGRKRGSVVIRVSHDS